MSHEWVIFWSAFIGAAVGTGIACTLMHFLIKRAFRNG
ncbi:hypothetical protein SEA_STIGMA_263 [Streptomyces phage Stigma]|uniref:Membrane protein n=1 Tax=Streptomyces phage Belfort TaxID=2801887 RepID=A0A7T8C1Y5_9CAUD|nr:membrane protein [Streptomyces phage Belfort]QZE11831.1 membrane protein [Streptomyces phage Karp]UTN92487.1 hypothetical protein SEA_STIGMA_263 [Streptomyces phage Stigma]